MTYITKEFNKTRMKSFYKKMDLIKDYQNFKKEKEF